MAPERIYTAQIDVNNEDAEEGAYQEFTESNTGLPSYTNRSRASRRISQSQPKTKLPKQKKTNTKISHVWWRVPVIPATWEAEAGELLEPWRVVV